MFTSRFLFWLAIVAIAIWFLVLQTSFSLWKKGTLQVYFLDVGQGDAILVITPEGEDILIDGGPGREILSQLGEVLPPFDHKIEYLILTHPEADHLGGLVEVAERFEIGQVIATGAENSTELLQKWKELIDEKEISKRLTKAGEIIDFGEVEMEIYFPLEFYPKESSLNRTSIIGKLVFQENEVMLTGDAEKDILDRLSALGEEELNSDILKVPHHGSKDAVSEEFIQAVSPDYAVILVGEKNRFGHPHPETLSLYEKLKIKLFRTDENGRVEARGDGKKWKIKSEGKG